VPGAGTRRAKTSCHRQATIRLPALSLASARSSMKVSAIGSGGPRGLPSAAKRRSSSGF